MAGPECSTALISATCLYGLYILHFPIIQTVVTLGIFAASPWQGAAIVVGATSGSALAMWWTIERPALRRHSIWRTL